LSHNKVRYGRSSVSCLWSTSIVLAEVSLFSKQFPNLFHHEHFMQIAAQE
jgi:hypothetical protein